MKIKHYFEQDKKLLIKVIAGVLLLAAAFTFYLIRENINNQEDIALSSVAGDNTENVKEAISESAIKEPAVIIIDVSGAVKNPRVVELTEGSRVFEAIEKAGGLMEDAYTQTINQAEILTDGQKLYIPSKKEAEAGQTAIPVPSSSGYSYSSLSQTQRININTADSSALQQLSGIGPATAEKIIDFRNQNGKFKTIEDIKNVSGIGEKTFEKFKDKITV